MKTTRTFESEKKKEKETGEISMTRNEGRGLENLTPTEHFLNKMEDIE